MSDIKMPWDVSVELQTTNHNEYGTQEIKVTNSSVEVKREDNTTGASIDIDTKNQKRKYGLGKPIRTFIIGNIKSDSDK